MSVPAGGSSTAPPLGGSSTSSYQNCPAPPLLPTGSIFTSNLAGKCYATTQHALWRVDGDPVDFHLDQRSCRQLRRYVRGTLGV